MNEMQGWSTGETILTGEDLRKKKHLPVPLCQLQISQLTGLESNRGLRDYRPATNNPNHGKTSYLQFCFLGGKVRILREGAVWLPFNDV